MSARPDEPRIAPGGRAELGLRTWLLVQVLGRVAGTRPPNLFLTLGRHRRLFRGWLSFASRLMPFGRLPRRDTELVILRVAHLRGCAYEFEHHVRLGARAGLRDADVERVKAGPDADGWSPRERLLLRATDELHATQDLSGALWTELSRELDERERIELVMLVGHYEMLATTIHTLRIQPDEAH
ncbi:MAG TPA: carboxymuconolactone decarboxylase family protein [Candidatus Binatia bacterium]